MAHPVTWFQISGKDGKKLQKFYKQMFAWKLEASPDGMAMVAADKPGGIPGGIGVSQNGKSSVAVYVNVDDLGKHLKKIEKAGGKTAMPPMELPGGMGSIAGFLDPAGNWVGLWEPAKKKPAKRGAKKGSKKGARKSKR